MSDDQPIDDRDPSKESREYDLILGMDWRAMEKLKKERNDARARADLAKILLDNQEGRHKRELAEVTRQRDRIAKAGQALVDRWETPSWKDVPHTGKFIRALSDAISSAERSAQ